MGGAVVKIPRRKFLHLAASATALPALARVAEAEAYPSRPVHVIVGYAASGPTDIAGRLISDWLSKRLNQQFVVEDRPGAGSNIATEFVLDSPPDGYTLLLATQSNAINQTLYSDMKFNYLNESVQIAGLLVAPSIMEVTPSFPANTIPEFIAYAKANPGKINLATAGNGSPPHMFGELFKVMAGVNMPTVAYRGGGPALIDLLAGQVQVMFEGITSSIGYVKSGKLRALGVTSAKRSPLLPDVPAIGEFVPGYDAAGWFGLAAPKGTPTEIIDILSKEVAAALGDPGMKARMAELGAEPMPMTAAEFTKLMADETVKWGKVIQEANIKIE
jgi:tripartite-type tricarboxylate transporter receptor subunit TctC